MAGETTAVPDEVDGWVGRVIYHPELAYRIVFYLAVGFFSVTSLFPLYWLLVVAVTPFDSLSNVGLLPNGFNPGVFVDVFTEVPLHWYIFNSIVLATATTVIVLVLASFAGYAFGRLEFRGRRALLLVTLAISWFPPVAFLLPLFRLLTGNVSLLGLSFPDLFNTPGALIVPYSAFFLPLAIYILTTFYSQIPDGLEDAARIEGSTRIRSLFTIVMPLSAPGVATAGILTFIAVYNEFFFAFIMTDGQVENWAPLVWGILNYQRQYVSLFNMMAAASIVGVVPVAALLIVAQEKIVSGLTAGALKE